MRIFIIGFMGSGKSHWGKIWAEESKMNYYDLDELIIEEEQLSINEIFEKKGEAYFRKIEATVLRSTIEDDNCIVSCGGGTPCFVENMTWMNENGVTVYLKGESVWLLQNMSEEIHHRPLFKNIDQSEILAFIEEKIKERSVFYDKAQIALSSALQNKDTIWQILSTN